MFAKSPHQSILSFAAKSLALRQIREIRSNRTRLENLSDSEIAVRSRALRFNAQSGMPQRKLLPDAFALAAEATRRVCSMIPYDVQLMAGINLCQSVIVEMATGEGKTLTALLPLYLRAIEGKGVLLATSNDYLAARDADFAKPVFKLLGMTVDAVVEDKTDDQRRAAYACDVTYGTAVQFGFDFLRDRAKARFNRVSKPLKPEMPVGRGRLYAIIADEADSLLIDDAATPLLIAGAAAPVSLEKQEAFRWAATMASQCQADLHYRYKKTEKHSELTAAGKQWLHQRLPNGAESSLSLIDYFQYVERAINVERDFLGGRDYIIQGEEIVLIDEGTGRIGKGRQWSNGIQQAVQAKEKLPITSPSGNLAKVTVQSFFLAFEHLSGMTGTGKQAESELKSNYRLSIREIPTRLPNRRVELTAIAFPNFQPWLKSIAEECKQMQESGRSVLIGARNVTHSEMISNYLSKCGITNQLLNARLDRIEAEIISVAGQPGKVTVATNMAGRGTDIELHPDVKAAGGLHVILAGIHASPRVDRQLIGRSGRQGDPGSFRKLLCLEDDLLDEAFTADRAAKIRAQSMNSFSSSDAMSIFERAQKEIGQRNRTSRKAMFWEEKKNLRFLHIAGLDPLLDVPS